MESAAWTLCKRSPFDLCFLNGMMVSKLLSFLGELNIWTPVWPLWHLSSLSQHTSESNKSRWCRGAEREREGGKEP